MTITILSIKLYIFLLLSIYLLQLGEMEEIEKCPKGYCFPDSSYCHIISNKTCTDNSESTCCEIVKGEYAFLCEQFGGECTKERCSERLTMRRAIDCHAWERCCILI